MTGRVEVIGNAILYLGDCRDILPNLDKFDAVVTDPPYGIGFAAQPTKWQRKAGKKPEAWDDFTIENLESLLKLGAVQIVWGGNYYPLKPSRGWLVWTKPDAPPSMSTLEMAWTNQDRNSKHIVHSISATNAERVGHPTQKPERVMDWTLAQFPAVRSVLDPFMGSGTIGVSAAKNSQAFTGIEIDERYFDIACRRIEQAQRQGDMFTSVSA